MDSVDDAGLNVPASSRKHANVVRKFASQITKLNAEVAILRDALEKARFTDITTLETKLRVQTLQVNTIQRRNIELKSRVQQLEDELHRSMSARKMTSWQHMDSSGGAADQSYSDMDMDESEHDDTESTGVVEAPTSDISKKTFSAALQKVRTLERECDSWRRRAMQFSAEAEDMRQKSAKWKSAVDAMSRNEDDSCVHAHLHTSLELAASIEDLERAIVVGTRDSERLQTALRRVVAHYRDADKLTIRSLVDDKK